MQQSQMIITHIILITIIKQHNHKECTYTYVLLIEHSASAIFIFLAGVP